MVFLSVAQQRPVAQSEEDISVGWRCSSSLFGISEVSGVPPLSSTCRSQAHLWSNRPFSPRLGPSRFAMRKVLCWAVSQSHLTSSPVYSKPTLGRPPSPRRPLRPCSLFLLVFPSNLQPIALPISSRSCRLSALAYSKHSSSRGLHQFVGLIHSECLLCAGLWAEYNLSLVIYSSLFILLL